MSRSTVWEKGKAHKNSKLTWQKVWDIRELYRGTNLTCAQIAPIFGVSTATIQRITSFKAWVKNEPS